MDFIVDIDGTVADLGHRLHWVKHHPKNWNAFFNTVHKDEPIWPAIEVVKALAYAARNRMVFCSGRPEKTRADTLEWLARHDLLAQGRDLSPRRSRSLRARARQGGGGASSSPIRTGP